MPFPLHWLHTQMIAKMDISAISDAKEEKGLVVAHKCHVNSVRKRGVGARVALGLDMSEANL